MSLSNDVELILGDDEFALKSSLKSATAVSNRFNGFQNAMTAIAAGDFASVCFVVRQGIALKRISTDDLNEAIYSAGTFKVAGPAMKYISRLANGGRDPADEEDATDAEAEGDRGNGEV